MFSLVAQKCSDLHDFLVGSIALGSAWVVHKNSNLKGFSVVGSNFAEEYSTEQRENSHAHYLVLIHKDLQSYNLNDQILTVDCSDQRW